MWGRVRVGEGTDNVLMPFTKFVSRTVSLVTHLPSIVPVIKIRRNGALVTISVGTGDVLQTYGKVSYRNFSKSTTE